MGRGKEKDTDLIRGAHAWAWMRRDPGYRAAWAKQAGSPRFEAAAFPLRVQTEADLAAADWALPVWEDPDATAWRSPFWSGTRMLVGEPDPDPWPDTPPLLPLLADAGARVEGLRLMSGRFILQVELGYATVPARRRVGARRAWWRVPGGRR